MEYRLQRELPPMSIDLQTLPKIIGKTYRKAKRWYKAYLVCQVCVLLCTVVSILARLNSNFVAVIAFLAILATEGFRWRSDHWKSQGEWAKRKWEIVDGLGIPLDRKSVADWLAAKPEGFLADVTPEEIQGSEFDSRRPRGPLRLVENIRESAWWSKHVSKRMVVFLGAVLALVLVAAFITLTISIAALKDAKVEQSGALVQNVGGIICSVLAFVVSINLIRLLADFREFALASKDILERCDQALGSTAVLEERDAFFIMHDYQIARSSAPLLPTFVWKSQRGHLLELWASLRPKARRRSSSQKEEPKQS